MEVDIDIQLFLTVFTKATDQLGAHVQTEIGYIIIYYTYQDVLYCKSVSNLKKKKIVTACFK